MSNSNAVWFQALRVGAIGGIVSVFIALTGMVTVFAERDIVGGVIDMGHTLILVAFFLTARFALRRAKVDGRSGLTIAVPALAVLVNAFLLAMLVVFVTAQPTIRNIFVNATPKLASLLIFDQNLVPGIGLLLAVGLGIGALTGLLNWLQSALRDALVNAVTLTLFIGLLSELFVVTFRGFELIKPVLDFLFASRSGLSLLGAMIVFVLVFAIRYVSNTRGSQAQAYWVGMSPSSQRASRLALIGVVVFVLLILPQLLGLFFSEILVNVGLFILMGLGLNIVVGFAGLLDLGYVAFFAIGAYSVGLITSTSTELVYAGGFPFWVGLPFAVVLAVFGGVVLGIPVLKVRGDYLAIVTLGFGEIIRLLALSDFLKPYFGGSRGVELIPKPFIGSFEFKDPQTLYYLVLAGCLLVAFVSTRVKNSRMGRAWMAMREDEDVAAAMGINLVTTKLLAFGMGASFAGIGGAIFASKLAIIYPHSFSFIISINVLALIIVGGMGSIPGVIVGGLALVGLPELLREFADFRFLIYGAVLVLMMLARPEGLWPEVTRSRELRELREDSAESTEDVETVTAES